MEPVWNHMLTCDYERTRPAASLLEWDLYTRSLLAWPATLMNVPEPYGRLRRPGIVDIDEDDHHRLLTQWHTLLRHDNYVPDLIARTTAWHRATEPALERAERALNQADRDHAYQHLGQATRVFLDVMSTHIVNCPPDRVPRPRPARGRQRHPRRHRGRLRPAHRPDHHAGPTRF
jgi:hypothetical protein